MNLYRTLPAPHLFVALGLLAAIGCGRGDADKAQGATSAGSTQAPAGDAAAGIRAIVAAERPVFAADDPEGKRTWKAVRAFYEQHGYAPAWFEDGKPRAQVQVLRDAVKNASAEGLNPAHYDVQFVDTLKPEHSFFGGDHLPADAVADADTRLTYTLARYADHLLRGRVRPGDVDKHWFGNQRDTDVAKVLKESLASPDLRASLAALAPRHPEYQALKKALAAHREIAAHGGWPAVPADALSLKPGKPGASVATLRARLVVSGDLPSGPVPAQPVFDAPLREGLKRFELRHGLKEDGLVDKETLAALNVPVEDRIRQIELNLERWRWLPEELGRRHILVNIPSFQLTGYDDGRPTIEMRVVAGKQDSPTPIFSDDMTTVVFSPYWNIPPDIAREETIPAMQSDPGYMAKNDLEVVRGTQVISPYSADWSDADVRIRQRPGAKNSLGLVKFLFPNVFDVYLHDTPADNLFARTGRDYSHGCVRVEKPFELAQWVMRSQPEWTPERIDEAMHAGVEKHVAIKEKIPVHIVYHTAWVAADGLVHFLPDVYGHDAAQEKVLPASPPPVAPARIARN